MKKQMSKEDKMRFDSLCNQIIEIACGNFMFRQESSGVEILLILFHCY